MTLNPIQLIFKNFPSEFLKFEAGQWFVAMEAFCEYIGTSWEEEQKHNYIPTYEIYLFDFSINGNIQYLDTLTECAFTFFLFSLKTEHPEVKHFQNHSHEFFKKRGEMYSINPLQNLPSLN